tara:strand:- start:149 stop:337 length:189 start_codon:yes stop_codon:yes gene_type:complete
MSKYDTVCYLGFTIKHNTEEPNVLENVSKIRLAMLSKIASMTDQEILSEIEYGETIDEGEYA